MHNDNDNDDNNSKHTLNINSNSSDDIRWLTYVGGGGGQKPEGLAKLAAPAQRCFKSVLPVLAEPGTCSNPLRVLIN